MATQMQLEVVLTGSRITTGVLSKQPRVAFGLPYLLIELFYIGIPVVRQGRSGGRSVYGHAITKFSWMGSLSHFFTHGAPLRAIRARELRYKALHYTP